MNIPHALRTTHFLNKIATSQDIFNAATNIRHIILSNRNILNPNMTNINRILSAHPPIVLPIKFHPLWWKEVEKSSTLYPKLLGKAVRSRRRMKIRAHSRVRRGRHHRVRLKNSHSATLLQTQVFNPGRSKSFLRPPKTKIFPPLWVRTLPFPRILRRML